MILRKEGVQFLSNYVEVQEAFLPALQRYAVLTNENGASQFNPVMSKAYT